MAKSLSHQFVLPTIIAAALRNARQAAVLLLGLALVAVPPQVVFGQSNQQQEQQQREQQEREQQQRDQQQREQQEREQQQRAQEQREQQQREQQERMQQQQQHSSSDFPAPSSNASVEASRLAAHPPATDVKRSPSDIQPLDMERKINSASAVNATATKDHASSPVEPDLRRKLCKDGPCQTCPAGQSKGKDGSCAPPARVVKNDNVRGVGSARTVVPQPCAAGQVWGGTQCLTVGAQQCLPGQSRVGTSCQADCAIPTTSAQNIIVELRSARLNKNDICLQNPTGKECQEAEAHHNLVLNEYRNFLGGVPAECRTALPDPIAI
jgi:hypothetical protein